MNYFLYLRKSSESEDRQVMSIDAQEHELLAIVKRDNLSVGRIFKESRSAKDEGRPVFNEMMKLIKEGKADGVPCWKLERLARNFADGGMIIDMLQRGIIQKIQTHDRLCLPSDNVLMLAVEFGMANQYVRDLSVNVLRGNREKLARGEWPNHAPLGYLNDKVTKKIIVDQEKKKYIVRMFELYATGGHGYKQISTLLYGEGLRSSTGNKIFAGYIQRIVTNPFYSGVMRRDGKYYAGIHEPIISKDLFDKAQDVSKLASRPRPKKLFFPLSGFLKCETCGCALTASIKKGHAYYYCTNGKGKCDEHKSYMRENYLYEKIADMFGLIEFDEETVELMYRAAKDRTATNENYVLNVINNLTDTLNSLAEKESRLLGTYVEGQIPKELYEAKMREITNEKVAVKKQIAETEKKTDTAFTLEPIKKIFL